MIGYDNWKAYNYRDDELGSIQDDEPIEEDENMGDLKTLELDKAAEAFVRHCKDYPSETKRNPNDFLLGWILARFNYSFHEVSECFSNAVQHVEDDATAERMDEKNERLPPYRDIKFNESTNRYGKGW